MQQTVKDLYQKRASEFQSQFETYSEKYNRLSVLRVVLFFLMAIGVVYFANARDMVYVFGTLLVFLVAFVALVKYHNKVAFRKSLLGNLKDINNDELARLDGKFHGFDSGEKHKNDKHAYTSDLDVFGKNSLFQLLNRCATESGKDMLAEWLQRGADKPEILERQAAISELQPKVEWRQEFEALGNVFKDDENHVHTLLAWMKEKGKFAVASWHWVALAILPLAAVATTVLYFMGHLDYWWPLLALAVNGIIIKKIDPYVTETIEKANTSLKILKAYLLLIPKIEDQDFQAPRLQALKAKFTHDNISAVAEIKKLKTILNSLEARANALFLIVNIMVLFDLYWLIKAEQWKKNLKGDAASWFEAISEFETLTSMAGYAYSNPHYAMPSISDKPHQFVAKTLGHPLIHESGRVSNDFTITEKGTINIITGSNMAGKSTFLRTIGVNAVLALAGAPVCASSMDISPVQLFTGMRTQDNLEESVSSFYAELQRIRQLLDQLENNDYPVMFMLDEILKGTNSADRHKGAEALIKQLSPKNVTGFVSTHDLSLGKMAEVSKNFKNYSFNSSVIGKEISFDYKISEGVCKSFNASQLMKNMGIEV